MASYLTPALLPRFYDLRRVLDLASDDPDVPAVEADLGNTASDAYALVNNSILAAESELDSHCQQGKRYTRAALELIITDADASPGTVSLQKRAAKIRQLVADLTYGNLCARRGMNSDRLLTLAPRYESAQASLEQLALGVTVFDLDENINAGVPASATFGLNSAYRPSRNNRMFGVFPDTFGPSGFNPYWN